MAIMKKPPASISAIKDFAGGGSTVQKPAGGTATSGVGSSGGSAPARGTAAGGSAAGGGGTVHRPSSGAQNAARPGGGTGTSTVGGGGAQTGAPSGFTGSAGGVGVYDDEQQSIKDQMQANSQAWWNTSDPAERARLAAENQRLGASLGGSVGWDPRTGTWSGDAAMGQQIPLGKPPAAQGPNYQDMGGNYGEFWQNGGYDGVSDAEQAAIDAYIKQQVGNLEAQRGGIGQSADEAARQAYISYMRSLNTLPQALSAGGYTGGMAESQRLGLDTTLQNNQNDIVLNRDNALNDLETAINSTKLEGSIQGAQAQAQLGRDAINAYLSYVNQKNAFANQDYWNQYGYDWQAAQNAYNKGWQSGESQKDRDWQSGESQAGRDWQTGEADKDRTQGVQQDGWNKAITLLQAGLMPTDAMLAAAGLDRATAQGWLDTIRQQQTAKTASGGSYGGTQDSTTQGTGLTQAAYDAAADRFDKGDYSAEVLDTLISAGENPDALAASAGYTSDIMSLGYGPVSDAVLARKAAGGEVQIMTIGGKMYYKRVKSTGTGGGVSLPSWADPATW